MNAERLQYARGTPTPVKTRAASGRHIDASRLPFGRCDACGRSSPGSIGTGGESSGAGGATGAGGVEDGFTSAAAAGVGFASGLALVAKVVDAKEADRARGLCTAR